MTNMYDWLRMMKFSDSNIDNILLILNIEFYFELVKITILILNYIVFWQLPKYFDIVFKTKEQQEEMDRLQEEELLREYQ